MPALAAELRRRWARRRPDVVHAHFWMSGWAGRAAAPDGVPFVQTFHALGSVKRRHQAAADTSPQARIHVERELLARADVVVATCRDEVAELGRLGPTDRVAVVPCGVADTFSPLGPVDVTPRRCPHRVVCVSRLVPRKGIADVIAALSAVPDAELVVVGDGDHAERVRLRDLAAGAGVAERVTFRGALDALGVGAVMRSADVVVCAPWYEPFGIVPLEAMACGVPVVGSAVGGLLDTVRHGVTGLLVPPRSPVALAGALDGLLRDPSRRRRMGAAAADGARAYRWPRVAGAVLEVYRAALQGASQAQEALA
jgi:glycosyltransferase involved in cell wall biosynthesis